MFAGGAPEAPYPARPVQRRSAVTASQDRLAQAMPSAQPAATSLGQWTPR